MTRALTLAAALLLPASLALPAAAQTPPDAKATAHAPAHPAAPAATKSAPLILRAPLPTTTSEYSPAPMPNLDISSPAGAPKVGPEFSGSLFAPRDTTGVASGYTDGSHYSTDLERRHSGVTSQFAPTLSLKIPFIYANQLQH